MKRKVTTITEEYDNEGKLKTKITETTEEEDTGYIYPQIPTYPYTPWTYPTIGDPVYKTEITCSENNEVN